MRSLTVVALAGVAVISLSIQASAQTVAKPFQLGIAGGVSNPTSDLHDIASAGYNGTLALGFNSPTFPLGLRIDGAYNHFGLKKVAGSGDVHVLSVTGNAVYKIPRATVSPYAIAGGGWYGATLGPRLGFDPSNRNHLGWNVGGGITMPLSGFDTFIEARYNQVQGDGGSLKFVPLTFGVLF
jgi:hypothetical protein